MSTHDTDHDHEHDHEHGPYGTEELVTVSDGGLRIMRQHLLESIDRIKRATDRDDEIDLAAFSETEMTPSNLLAGAEASIGYTIDAIEDELDRRDAEYEPQ